MQTYLHSPRRTQLNLHPLFLPSRTASLLVAVVVTLMASISGHGAGLVLFNEISYHPTGNEAVGEWIEFYNAASVDVDLTGWQLSPGVTYRFPQGTIIRAGGHLLLASSPPDLAAVTGLTNIAGPFIGKLSNTGESLELHDSAGRTMDAVKYGVDGDWPPGADGSGFTLAKKTPIANSKLAESWTVSAQPGGSPSAPNFPPRGVFDPAKTVFSWDQSWRWDDSGIDPGTVWRQPTLDDSSWPRGQGIFHTDRLSFTEPVGTAVHEGRTTYYFRTSFNVVGDPNTQQFQFRELLDDGAVVYLNGVEVSRINLPNGNLNATITALRPASRAFITPWFTLPASNIVAGTNIIAVELHQSPASTHPSLRMVPSSGIRLVWDGEEGTYFSPENPAPAPTNAASASLGTEVLVSSNPGSASQINDGFYGHANSWSPTANDASPTVVLRFASPLPLSAVAWSRDNGNMQETICAGGCTDRAVGSYALGYTLATNVSLTLTNGSNPSNSWVSLGTVQYVNTTAGFIPALRHQFNLGTSNSAPLMATGFRLRAPGGVTLDEIEVNPPPSAGFHAAFGMELQTATQRPTPPSVVFNEISPAGNGTFWVELMNLGDSPVDLANFIIARGGTPPASRALGHITLNPGASVSITRNQLGFGATEGTKIFLYSPGRSAVLDSVVVHQRAQARFPDGVGAWRTPTATTPGETNRVVLQNSVVFSEIMSHAPPFDRVAPVETVATLVNLQSSGWRFDDTGIDRGDAWKRTDYDDSNWATGTADFGFPKSSSPNRPVTLLSSGPLTDYFRKRFVFQGDPSRATLQLRAQIDDGAVFYLNGVEIHRANMPIGPITANTSAVDPVGSAVLSATIPLPAQALVQGENVLAVEVHQAISTPFSTGIDLRGGGLELIQEGPTGTLAPDNLARFPGVKPFVIDSLAGFPIHDYLHLNDGVTGNSFSWIGNSGNPGYAGLAFGSTQSIHSVAFARDNQGLASDRTLGLYTLQYTQVPKPGTATTQTGNPATGWAPVGTLNYIAAGTGYFLRPSIRHQFLFTPVDATAIRLLVPQTGISAGTCIDELEVNPPPPLPDLTFDMELKATITESPGAPFTLNNEEWVELHNRSTSAVDLSGWQMDGGIRFTIPSGTIIQPGEQIVVAKSAADLKELWPEIAPKILGDFSGKLSDGELLRLLDLNANPVNETHLHAGPWSDGGGSSSELVDVRADTDSPDAWQDSDESGRADWQSIRYRMVAGQKFGNTFWNEFRFGMLAPGIVLVDDVQVLSDPGGLRQNLVQNGDFESTETNAHWRMLGDHSASRVIVDPSNPANHVLRIVASSPARTSHNHVESTFIGNKPLVDGREYEVSFRARWVAGSPQLQSSAYHQRLAKTTLLTTPQRYGTPGAPNSRRVPNFGPTFVGLQHSPAIPRTNESVTVSVGISDPDAVVSATLHYRLNRSNTFNPLPMSLQANGRWSATLPPQSAGKIVQFFVTATDSLGASNTAPVLGAASRALYQVADNQTTKLPIHELRLIQLDSDRSFLLNATNVMSQDRLGGTVIYDRNEVFYDCGIRLHGSAASRARDGDDFISYDIEFPSGHLFRGVQGSVAIDRSGRSPVQRNQDEIYVLHMFHRAGVVCHHDDLCYFIAPFTTHTGTAIMQLGGYDSLFVNEQFGADGTIFNFDGSYEPSITEKGGAEGLKLPVPLLNQESTDLTDLGPDFEQYRAPFDIRHGERRDDFTYLRRLGMTFDLPQNDFDKVAGTALDVEEAMRVTALTILCGIGDIYLSPVPSFPHNLRLWTPADGGPAMFLPWDMDFVFYLDANESILPTSSAHLSKLAGSATLRRRYLWHIQDLCNTAFHPSYMSSWLNHYGSVVGQGFSDNLTYIQTRRNAALSQIPAPQPFSVKPIPAGANLITQTTDAVVEGTAWLDVSSIRLTASGRELPMDWTTVTNWRVRVPVMLGLNVIGLEGRDRSGGLVGSGQISLIGTVFGGGIDSDGDGIPDEWENSHQLNPLANDAALDPDGDDLSNLDEYKAGTDPQDPLSALTLEATQTAGANTVQLRFLARAGRSYSILWRGELTASGWTKLSDSDVRASDRVVSVSESPANGPGTRFYRVVTPSLR